jgi:glycosyltransferase involved in cell wall biosynthesis
MATVPVASAFRPAGGFAMTISIGKPAQEERLPRTPRVSVVVPALNEAKNLQHVLAKLPRDIHELIVVDGHSVDDTVAVARQLRPDAMIVLQTRKGKGNALACGFAAATGDIIVTLDADGSADPAEIPRFIEALTAGADFAKGSRFLAGGGSSDITRIRALGNRALCLFVNILYRTRYTDLCYGYNAFWHRVLPVVSRTPLISSGPNGAPWGDGFEIETLITIRVAHAGLKVTEVASFEHPRMHGVSNLNAATDGWRVLRTIFAERAYVRSQRSSLRSEPDLEHLSSVVIRQPR